MPNKPNPYVNWNIKSGVSTEKVDTDIQGFIDELIPKVEADNVTITSLYRPDSKHRHGKGQAVDLRTIDGKGEILFDYLSSAEGIQLMHKYGVGLLDERDQGTLNQTGGSGQHFHVGKDSWLVGLNNLRYESLYNNEGKPHTPSVLNAEGAENYSKDRLAEINRMYGYTASPHLKTIGQAKYSGVSVDDINMGEYASYTDEQYMHDHSEHAHEDTEDKDYNFSGVQTQSDVYKMEQMAMEYQEEQRKLQEARKRLEERDESYKRLLQKQKELNFISDLIENTELTPAQRIK